MDVGAGPFELSCSFFGGWAYALSLPSSSVLSALQVQPRAAVLPHFWHGLAFSPAFPKNSPLRAPAFIGFGKAARTGRIYMESSPAPGDFSERSFPSLRVSQGLWKKCPQYYWTCMFVKPIKDLVKKTPPHQPKPKVGLGDVPDITSLYPDTSPAPQEMLAKFLSSAGTSPPATSREKHAAS